MNDDDRKRIKEANLALVKGWKPASVFHFFAELSAIPRGSGNVGKVADFLVDFAVQRGLEHERDALGNVIIRKAGKAGTAGGVILQAHQDMVCVKNVGVDHDFTLDPIEFTTDQTWLRAKGTTLGADDGIGVALALAVLDDPAIAHPPLEALFTVDEETDMKGIKAIKPESLRGDTLINIDAEELGIAFVSSAAGVGFRLHLPLVREATERPVLRGVMVGGLLGGHSGVEINKGRANAYVLLARFLAVACKELEYTLHSFAQGEGHGADNAIPDRAVALLGFASEEEARKLDGLAKAWTAIFQHEYYVSDPGVRVSVLPEGAGTKSKPLAENSRNLLLDTVRLLPLGVFRFVQTRELGTVPYGDLLVESSCSLGIVNLEENQAVLSLLARSSTQSVLDDFMERMEALARMAGGNVEKHNQTPGWEMPAEPTRIMKAFQQQGLRLLGLHAGLECGCLVEAFVAAGRKLDAVSVGPDLKDVHSPQERLGIKSVESLWGQLLAVLAAL